MRACASTRVVLVVEDDWIVRSDIVAEFQAHGWLVLETATGEDALSLLRDHHVDAIFTDIQLAGHINGWDVAERSRAVRSDLPVIYTSGNALDRSRRTVGSMFFSKPYVAAEVVEACQKLAGPAT
jgi:CheY-like chemotaxis protein